MWMMQLGEFVFEGVGTSLAGLGSDKASADGDQWSVSYFHFEPLGR